MKAIKNYIYINSNFFWNNLYRLNKKHAQRLIRELLKRGHYRAAYDIADHCSADYCDELLNKLIDRA